MSLSPSRKRIVLLGATGSIGENTLRVIAAHRDRLELVGIAARANHRRLAEIARQFGVRHVAIFENGALAEAERGGHAFIALKWFRDSFLPRKVFRWNQHPETRQVVLAEAIQRGVVLTSKIANPKTPAYPTTTIRLNRAEAGIPEEAQRFHPVEVQGEPVAVAIDEDRGSQ